ncbi:MAG: hypothetical protein WA636_07970, partial [Methylovirgula sp.]
MLPFDLRPPRQQLIKVPTPPRRVLSLAQALGARGIKDTFDTAADPRRRLGFAEPNRLKHFEDIVGPNCCDRLFAQRGGVRLKRALPLRCMLLVSEAGCEARQQKIGDVAKGLCRCFSGLSGAPCLNGISAAFTRRRASAAASRAL